MAYHVTILRTERGERILIAKEEVKKISSARPELAIEESRPERLVLTRTVSNREDVLVWQDGEIWAANPDRELLQFMIDLAADLRARVRGDELETYTSPEQTYLHPDDHEEEKEADLLTRQLIKRRKRNQILLNLSIVGFFAVLVVIVSWLSR